MSIGPSLRVVTHFLNADLPFLLWTSQPSVLSRIQVRSACIHEFPVRDNGYQWADDSEQRGVEAGFSSVVRSNQDMRASDCLYEFPVCEQFAPGRWFVVSPA